MPPVRAVIFDFGGVLCFHPDDPRWQRAAKAAGMPVDAFQRAFWADRIEYDAGRIEPAAYWRKVIGPAFDESRLPELIRCEIELWNNYDQRVFDWIRQLKNAGHPTAILSNLPRVLGEELRRTPGFLDPFDHVTFSYELQEVKPQAPIYLDAIAGLQIHPAQGLFLDDKPENIAGAGTVGLQAELYSSWEDFVRRGVPAAYGLPAPGLVEDVARRQ